MLSFGLGKIVIAIMLPIYYFNQSNKKAQKDMEWYAAFALTVTLVWIYIEVLKLLAKLKKKIIKNETK